MNALSQEGSTIETAVEIVRGVVPEPSSSRMDTGTFRLRNHPWRHRKERDDAALLTQEGNSQAFTVSIILCAKANLDRSAWPGGAIFICKADPSVPIEKLDGTTRDS
jgi:hypothetical protein